MARPIPRDRFDQLIRVAANVFIAVGYRRTQMADVAEALGVAKGTVYLYVESKEALFDIVARHVDDESPIPCPDDLPVEAPPIESTLEFVRERIRAQGQIEPLARALAGPPAADARAELEGIVHAVYDVLHRNRRGIKLLDRSAVDRPDIAALWFEGGRDGLLAALTIYLRTRIDAGLLRAVPDVDAAARGVVEILGFWAVHRHWDAHPQHASEETARATSSELIVRMFAHGGRQR
jgi:AcrR family transcriptional regulator